MSVQPSPEEGRRQSDIVWEVVGGGAKGGIVAREGISVDSPEVPGRLATGTLVREVELAKDGVRLRFEKLSGEGPQHGWVSVSFRGKDLLVKRSVPAGAITPEGEPHRMTMQEKIDFFNTAQISVASSPGGSAHGGSAVAKLADLAGDGQAANNQEAAMMPDCEGHWRDTDNVVSIISGGKIFMNGATVTCKFIHGRHLEVSMEDGTRLSAQLMGDKLLWDDGDIWTRDEACRVNCSARGGSETDCTLAGHCAVDGVNNLGTEVSLPGRRYDSTICASLDGSSLDCYAPGEFTVEVSSSREEEAGWKVVSSERAKTSSPSSSSQAKQLSWATDVNRDASTSGTPSELLAKPVSPALSRSVLSDCKASASDHPGMNDTPKGGILDHGLHCRDGNWSVSTVIPRKNKRLSWADICDLETCEGSDEWSDAPSTGTGFVTDADVNGRETAASSTPSLQFKSGDYLTGSATDGASSSTTCPSFYGACDGALPVDSLDASMFDTYSFQPVALPEAGVSHVFNSADTQSYGYSSSPALDMYSVTPGSPEDIASQNFAYSCCFAPFEDDESAMAWWLESDGMSTATPSSSNASFASRTSSRKEKPKSEAHARALAAAQQHQTYQTAVRNTSTWPSWWQGEHEQGASAALFAEDMAWQFEECQMWDCAQAEEHPYFISAECEAGLDSGGACSSFNDTYADKLADTAKSEARPSRQQAVGCGDGASSNGSSSERHERFCYSRRNTVPKKTNLEKVDDDRDSPITTLMIRNVPNPCTQKLFIEELDKLGLHGQYDFVYLPMDRATRWNVGYGFVNFTSVEAAETCTRQLAGQCFSRFPMGKPVAVSPAHLQGLESNVRHYRNSAVQNSRLPGDRPLIVGSVA